MGARLDIRCGKIGTSSGGGEASGRGRISNVGGLVCWTGASEPESMDNLTQDLRFDGLKSSTGERGRATASALGGDFLVPFRSESCDFPGVVLTMDGIGGASETVLFIAE